jgi:hypothetical protein
MTSLMTNNYSYDFIGFGDEVPGVLALVCAAREYRRQTGQYPHSLLMFKRNSHEGIGGHLVRGKLGYLDRSHPARQQDCCNLNVFGDAPAIYKEFLRRSGTDEEIGIALDPAKADLTLRQMLHEAEIDILSSVNIQSVLKQGQLMTGIKITDGNTYCAKQFIDSTVNAELAQLAGVKKKTGFETLGLPESELPVTLVFETKGLSVEHLKAIELHYLKRLNDAFDIEAQRDLEVATGSDAQLLRQLRTQLSEDWDQLKTMSAGRDYVDVRSFALSIAYHAFRGTKLSLAESHIILDKANIAVLPHNRLLWNALLIEVNASQSESLAKGGARPTDVMLQEISFLKTWLKSLGATAVFPASELYIRHAGNVTDVMSPLSGAKMLAGGVFRRDALGTFSYSFDVRGGIAGVAARAIAQGTSLFESRQHPQFNLGIQHALLKSVPNLAVVSPASGFTGYGCTAGRIVEFNVGVGQGVGIACALAVLRNQPVANISDTQVRRSLQQMDALPKIYEQIDAMGSERLYEFETRMAEKLPQKLESCVKKETSMECIS